MLIKTNMPVAVLLVILVVLAGCNRTSSPATPATPTRSAGLMLSAKDLDLMEILFREMISHRPWNKLWFLEIANENRPGADSLPPLRGYDPSPEFLKRFADLPVVIRPASQAKKNLIGIQDRSTGEDGYVAIVRIVRWIDEGTAEFIYTDYHDSEAASGATGTAHLEAGKWVIEEKNRWLS